MGACVVAMEGLNWGGTSLSLSSQAKKTKQLNGTKAKLAVLPNTRTMTALPL
ncbi:MAG: hypothetical protein JRF33_09420 [Deltaproteobacteria bacterium]|nr:hypothetical protein [Deltaproteobacteria bacterium]